VPAPIYDVVIAGGGPGGSTCGALLRKYHPDCRVLVVEREKFPREHVGESHLPQIGQILYEMGVWDDVETADFPIKIGATYLWGKDPEMWDFNFIAPEKFAIAPRPAPYAGQRRQTALQVDRAIYDDILLRHAQKLGCEVRQATAVDQVLRTNDRVDSLRLSDGSTVQGRIYVDASGNAAVIRRALNVPVDCPTLLKNIAIWDYWENAEWADSIGIGGTRVQVISVGYGWLWFIPLGPTRTSVGLVCPAEYYKQAGKTPDELYQQAIADSDRISELTAKGRREGKVRTTNDWSFVSERTTGENWLLVGETAGFADPILAAGLTLTHTGGREAAYSILALLRGDHDPAWIKEHYHQNQVRRVRQHMRFAEFWYSANGQFKDLQEHCREIAATSGLNLDAKQAWAWLAQGGFTNDIPGQAVIGGFDLGSLKQVTMRFMDQALPWNISDHNTFRLNLAGATLEHIPEYKDGRINRVPCHVRNGRRLPLTGLFQSVVTILEQTDNIETMIATIVHNCRIQNRQGEVTSVMEAVFQVLEVLVSEGWVVASLDPTKPRLNVSSPLVGDKYRVHQEFRKQNVEPVCRQ
jgi:flavin-dependent dehydrogenase